MRPRISSFSSSSSTDSGSSSSSIDEEDFNIRVNICWESHRKTIERRGFQLETFRDVKQYYERCWNGRVPDSFNHPSHRNDYLRACGANNDEALCKDAGLPDNLFRGKRSRDGKAVVIKAVHLRSREFEVIRVLSTPPLRADPMNHTIPVLDLIAVPDAEIGFIVQEEWSSQLVVPNHPCSLRKFLSGIRQCIEGLVFMHAHHIAHLDISLRNVLTDPHGHYRYIDFEMSRRYDGVPNPRICGCRGTEMPPEIERGEESDPFKVDVWALAVLILHACKLTVHDVSELVDLTRSMLHHSFEARPSARAVLHAFEYMYARIPDARLRALPQ